MRYIYIVLVTIVTIIVLVFAFQNTRTTTVSFFSASVSLPLWIIVLAAYVVGALTGGIVFSFLRSLVYGAIKKKE